MPDSDIAYRSVFNKSRAVYAYHPNLAAIAPLLEVLGDRGFMTTIAASSTALDRLIGKTTPDIVLIQLEAKTTAEALERLLNSCMGSRIYVLMDSTATAAEVARAMRNGATFVFAALFDPIEVLAQIESDLRDDIRVVGGATQVRGLNSLSARERESLGFVVAGESNKDIGTRLDLSPRTVEVHRAHAMRKLGARNAAEMVRIVLGRR